MTQENKDTILHVEGLVKRFKNVTAVKKISFELQAGEIFAFLGPNGAGKTTTLRMLLDIIKPDSGDIRWNVNGSESHLPASQHLGYLPEERGLYTDVPIIRSLVYLAGIRGMNRNEARKSAMEWLEKLDLADRAKEKLQTLSKGNQQKIQFVASILHKPRFAILDEPFSGLDPINQEKFIQFIRELNQQGTTILLSAHQMQLIEKLADKIFMLNHGQEVFHGTLDEIYKKHGDKHILELSFNTALSDDHIRKLNHAESLEKTSAEKLSITFGRDTNLNEALSYISTMEGLVDIRSHKPTLHDIFLQLAK